MLACQQLSVYERSLLSDLVEIHTPFEEATDFTRRQNSISVSFVIPCIRRIRASLEILRVKYKSNMLKALQKSLDDRMGIYEQREQYIFAAILDPRLKLDWCTGSESARNESTFKKYVSNMTATKYIRNLESQIESPPEPPSKKCKLVSFMTSLPSQSPMIASLSKVGEINLYLSEPRLPEEADVLAFWKFKECEFQTLSKIAQRYLSVPASSAPVERLFSVSGKFFRPDRCSLNDEVFHKLITVKSNGYL